MKGWFLCAIGLLLLGCHSAPAPAPVPPISIVDSYLDEWSLMSQTASAQDVAAISTHLRSRQGDIEFLLANLINQDDKQAPSRLVYWQVIQVGSYISADTPLGKACAHLFNGDVKVRTISGDRLYFGGDMYLWWLKHRGAYEPYDPLTRWEATRFAQQVTIPEYEKYARQHPPGSSETATGKP